MSFSEWERACEKIFNHCNYGNNSYNRMIFASWLVYNSKYDKIPKQWATEDGLNWDEIPERAKQRYRDYYLSKNY